MIKMLKLVSGEELIADIKNLDDSRNDLIITEPFQFGMGQEGIVMVPFMPLADTEEVHLSRSSIVTILNPNKSAEESYTRMTGKILLMEHGPLIH